jgi:hypothetical protein
MFTVVGLLEGTGGGGRGKENDRGKILEYVALDSIKMY